MFEPWTIPERTRQLVCREHLPYNVEDSGAHQEDLRLPFAWDREDDGPGSASRASRSFSRTPHHDPSRRIAARPSRIVFHGPDFPGGACFFRRSMSSACVDSRGAVWPLLRSSFANSLFYVLELHLRVPVQRHCDAFMGQDLLMKLRIEPQSLSHCSGGLPEPMR